MNDHSWNTNYEKIRAYFPLANFNRETADLYKRKMMLWNQWHLAEAIDQVRMKYSTFADNPPELKWFLLEYERVEQSRRPAKGKYEQVEKWWVDYEQPSKHTGAMYAFSTDCPDRATAEKIAQETGGRVRSSSQGLFDDQMLIEQLKATPRAEIAEAISSLRHDGMIQGDPLPSDFSKWSSSAIGKVSAQVQITQQRKVTQ